MLISYYAAALWATLKRDALIFASYRLRLASEMLSMFFVLTMFFYLSKLVRPHAIGPHGSYYVFVVVGIVTMAVVEAGMNLAHLVRTELIAGNFERVLLSPFGPVAGVASLGAFPIVVAVLFAGATLGLAAGVFGMPVHLTGIPVALFVALIAGVAFAAIGLLFVAALIAFKSALGSAFVITALGLAGGAFFPVALFPWWVRWVSNVQPLTPALDLLRHALVGTALTEAAWLDVVKLIGFAAVLMPISVAVLWQALKLSRRRGTIMEY